MYRQAWKVWRIGQLRTYVSMPGIEVCIRSTGTLRSSLLPSAMPGPGYKTGDKCIYHGSIWKMANALGTTLKCRGFACRPHQHGLPVATRTGSELTLRQDNKQYLDHLGPILPPSRLACENQFGARRLRMCECAPVHFDLDLRPREVPQVACIIDAASCLSRFAKHANS